MNLLFLLLFFHLTKCWINDYLRRQKFNITSMLKYDESDLDFSVVIDTESIIVDSKMRGDCFDAIFSFFDDSTLSFWLEGGCNTPNTTFWVRIPQINSGENITLYMYYDNTGIASFQGDAWNSNYLGFFKDNSCESPIVNFWATAENALVKGSSSQNTGQGGLHSHSVMGTYTSTVAYGDEYLEDSAESNLATGTHYHEIDVVDDVDSVDAVPLSRGLGICYSDSDNRLDGLLPVGSIGFFDHTNPISGWDSGLIVNTNEEFVMAVSAGNLGNLYGSPTHSHSLDFTSSTIGAAVGGTSVGVSGAGVSIDWSETSHDHNFEACSTNETNNEPACMYLNARRATSSTSLPGGIIIFGYCTAECSSPPFGWDDYSDLNGFFLRGSNDPSRVGTFGGSDFHSHGFGCLTEDDMSSAFSTDDSPFELEITWDVYHVHAFNGTTQVGMINPVHTEIRFLKRKMDNVTTMQLLGEEFLCYSILNTLNPCNDHGDCVDVDNCHCNAGWFAAECNITHCNGHFSNETASCGEHGTCIDIEYCDCDPNWFGVGCNITFCKGHFSNESESCGEHGTCIDTEYCDCDPSWFGKGCNITHCNGHFSNETASCGEHGTCSDTEYCNCDSNWFGEGCNITFCNGHFSNESESCGEHGTCTDTEYCDCDPDWFGEGCNVTHCYGIFSNETASCGIHGTCTAPSYCNCDNNWVGEECYVTFCNGHFSNESESCGVHGTCIDTEYCACDPDWYGEDVCNITFCNGHFSNETASCGEHGACTDTEYCDCDPDWFGEGCNVTHCYGIFSNETASCGIHGTCTAPSYCNCDNNWVGEGCDVTFCNGHFSNESESCGVHGSCTDTEYCACDPDWYGEDVCNITICNGHFSNETGIVCSGNGECVTFNGCDCNDTHYGGDDCELVKCYGELENETDVVCSGNGDCEGPDHCVCHEGNFGQDCSTYDPAYFSLINDGDGPSHPGGRSRMGGAVFARGPGTQSNSFLIIFGGFGNFGGDNNSTITSEKDFLSDLWRFDFVTESWSFIKGSNVTGYKDNQFGISSMDVFDSEHQPGSRSGFSYFSTPFSFFIFGGDKSGTYDSYSNENIDATTNELWELSILPITTQFYWRLLQTENISPNSSDIPPRRTFSSVARKFDDQVYIFGGGRIDEDDNFMFFSDLWTYDILRNTFTQLRSTTTNTEELDPSWNMTDYFDHLVPVKGVMNDSLSFNPPARTQHLSWVDVNDQFFIFSGTLRNMKSSNDVWRYNSSCSSWAWIHGFENYNYNNGINSEIVGDGHYYNVGNSPAARSSSLTFLNQDFESIDGVLMFGGMNLLTGDTFSDMWAFSTVLGEWKFVNGSTIHNEETSSSMIGGRFSGIGVRTLQECMIIFGGES